MNNYGVIYDIKNDKAVVLTRNSNFIMIHRREDMFLGQQIAFDDKDIYLPKKNLYKHVSICASIAAVFVLIFIFLRMIPGNADIYGYVAVDINPSMEFYINREYEVLKAVALNDDAAKLIKNIQVTHKSIETVIIEIIKESKKYGYIKPEEKADVLISASLNDTMKETSEKDGAGASKLDRLLHEIEKEIEGHDSNIAGKMIRVTPEEREAARKYDISMGKYDLFLKAGEQGIDISINEINAMKISDLIKVIGIEVWEPSVQASKDTGSVPLTTSIPKETSKTEQITKNSATPIPQSTPANSLLQNRDIKPSSGSVPAFTPENKTEPKEDTLTNPTLKPSDASKAQSTTDSTGILKLRHYNEEQNVSSQAIRWDFVIENTGTEVIDLKNVKVRYYFKEDVDKTINFTVYFYSLGEEKSDVNGKIYNITKSDSANRYLEVTFKKGSISPGETAWVFGAISREDWSEFNQEDDWSFNRGASTFSEWNKMTLYISDRLVWGIEPG